MGSLADAYKWRALVLLARRWQPKLEDRSHRLRHCLTTAACMLLCLCLRCKTCTACCLLLLLLLPLQSSA